MVLGSSHCRSRNADCDLPCLPCCDFIKKVCWDGSISEEGHIELQQLESGLGQGDIDFGFGIADFGCQSLGLNENLFLFKNLTQHRFRDIYKNGLNLR